MRSKKALINTIILFLVQLVTIIYGMIIPRMIITQYGSSVNGLISSITQFLGYIVLLEAGVGGVVRASLYKPLANKDVYSISRIVKSTENFFKIIAGTFILYLLMIASVFPYMVKENFDFVYTSSLVIIIGISTFFQYYFGITYQILLQADQRQYVNSVIQIITIIANSVLVIILIRLDVSIHIVKLLSTVVFIIRPLLLNLYVKYNYNIIKDCKPDKTALDQKWDGFGHHVAFLLHSNTDIGLLTIFSSVKEISVYSVYYMIISSMKSITVTFLSSIEAAFGNMIAKGEQETLNRNFEVLDFLCFSVVTILFTSTAILIIPFIGIYTEGIVDANYYRPIFAYTLLFAEAIYCIRVPYSAVICAAGHYKQTKNIAFMEAIINVFISIILVNICGILGVAIGTLCAISYRTFIYVKYLSNNIIKRNWSIFIKKLVIYISTSICIIFIIGLGDKHNVCSYFTWIIYAIKVTLISLITTMIAGIVFFKKEIILVKQICYRLVKKTNKENN